MSNIEQIIADTTLNDTEKLDKIVEGLDQYFRPEDKMEYQDVRIWPTHVEVEINKVKKSLSMPDFKCIFEDLLQETLPAQPLALPFNCFISSQSMTNVKLSCYYPERIAEIKFQSRSSSAIKTFKIPMPNVIITHDLGKDDKFWVVKNTKYFCTDKSVPQLPDLDFINNNDPSKGIYPIPLPNFYPDGRMCYGGNTMPTRMNNNLRGLDYYYQILTLSPFNEDLGIRGTKKSIRNVQDWLTSLSNKTAFDFSEMAK